MNKDETTDTFTRTATSGWGFDPALGESSSVIIESNTWSGPGRMGMTTKRIFTKSGRTKALATGLSVKAIEMGRPPRFGDVFRWDNGRHPSSQPVAMYVRSTEDNKRNDWLGVIVVGAGPKDPAPIKAYVSLTSEPILGAATCRWLLIEEGPE